MISGGSQCPRHFQVAGIFLGQKNWLFADGCDFVGLFCLFLTQPLVSEI